MWNDNPSVNISDSDQLIFDEFDEDEDEEIDKVEEPQQPQPEEHVGLWKTLRRSGRLLAVKPVMILYSLSYVVTMAVTSQLWIDRVCSVNLGYNATVCSNLTDKKFTDFENKVQETVTQFSIAGSYIENIPNIIMALYLGPWSDRGRKPLMLLPFVGHIFSIIFVFLFLHFDTWPAQMLWVTNIYVLFGGYTLLQIAMYGYIGDVTNAKERTMIIAILSGLGFIMFPLAEFASGQIYKAGGYYAVYATSLAATLSGIAYVCVIPESVTRRTQTEDASSDIELTSNAGFCQKIRSIIIKGNQTMLEAVRCFLKQRPNNVRVFIFVLIGVTLFSGLSRPWSSLLLFVEKKFGWTVVDYTNYQSYAISIYAIRTFITVPVLCYWLRVHDCMLAITGAIAAIGSNLVFALATKGWMMYYAAAITIFAGIESTAITAILSKCVEPNEFGKIFTMSSVMSGIADLGTSSLMQVVYEKTVDTNPSVIYYVSTAFEGVILVSFSFLFYFINRHEERYGPLGKNQNQSAKAS